MTRARDSLIYYQDNLVTLHNGDCRQLLPGIVEELKSDGYKVAIVTDPPYGIGSAKLWDGKGRDHGSVPKAGRYSTKMVGNDEPYDPQWLLDMGVPLLMFGANHFADKLPPETCWVIWDKRGSTRAASQGLPSVDQSDCEMAWTNFGGPARLITHQWMGIVRDSERNEPRIHVTQKPVALMRWILQKFVKPDVVILEPYAGSCSLLRAAKDLGRTAIGIEIDEDMCEKATPRLAQEVLPFDLSPAQQTAEPVVEAEGLF